MKLSILDQSPVVAGQRGTDAITQTMDLVQHADALGFHRYWFAEHHASASFAGASPEIMMANAAARTSRIRVGSGGILLGHGEPFRIAESLRTLEALAPGRVDAGFGRAPGGDQRVMKALGERPLDSWERLDTVLAYLRDAREPSNDGAPVAVPDGASIPEPWILGTSAESAMQAAKRGLRYTFGSFIDPTNLVDALTAYHANFTPSVWCDRPYTMIATVAFAAETEADAQRAAQSSERWFVESFLRGKNVRFPHVNGESFDVSAMERVITGMRRSTVHIGTATQVADGLRELQQRYAVDELALVTITDDHAVRRASYELLSDEFSLASTVA
jgi:luciferase family oxidoreductase group 1